MASFGEGAKKNRSQLARLISTARTERVELEKQQASLLWAPEYAPVSLVPPSKTPDAIAERWTRVSYPMIAKSFATARKVKLICTLGPACWSEEGLAKLMDAGMNIARFNFSHGDHDGHKAVLDRVRKVAAEKGQQVCMMLDTKGPEIRTAMLKEGKDIHLTKGQEITIYAAGDEYTTWEGFQDAATGETVIGCSYPYLCRDVKPGSRILIADGTISVEVLKIVDGKHLVGKVLNDRKLGQRKNMALPGVHVDIPVLTDKDIKDVKDFACKHGMDMIAASFVQTPDDVKLIRKVLKEGGGENIKIMSKIESMTGLVNYDEILKETDGIMVARGDLAMEIPSEKVALAQKMMIIKANVAGKFVTCATEMLASMQDNPLPTRAEMTDVANAVFDGVDCTMLSGESANGKFPDTTVATMAAIVENAELGIDYPRLSEYIRYRNAGYGAVSPLEAMLSTVAKIAADFSEDRDGDGVLDATEGCVAICISQNGVGANLISKYRPCVPLVVVSSNDQVLRQTNSRFGQYPCKVESITSVSAAIETAVALAKELKLAGHNKKAIVVTGDPASAEVACDKTAIVEVHVLGSKGVKPFERMSTVYKNPSVAVAVRQQVSIHITLEMLANQIQSHRGTKVVCTLGPACWSEEGLEKLLDAGLDVARFNFSHGDHEAHQAVLDRFRKVAAKKGAQLKADLDLAAEPQWATALDTKGPEIRTAMLKDHKKILLEKGQEVIIEAVGDKYTEFEGYKTDTETRIGLSYAKLCQSLKPGNRILIADGTIVIEVMEIISATELQGMLCNTNELGERKNCNLPGVHVDLPVLTEKDINDVQNFACKNQMNYIFASFVQKADDVRFIRSKLDEAGGQDIKIVVKIENEDGLANYDEILAETDGVMVARGDLGMEIPSEKVCLAQKMMITKAHLAGKFVITATQMLASMEANPLPTRSEMTDVANAVFDGTDATMLSGESANGAFPDTAVATMAKIVQNAEEGMSVTDTYNFVRNFTPKPMSSYEASCSSAVQATIDMHASLMAVVTNSLKPAMLTAKYRPPVPVIVITNNQRVAQLCRGVRNLVGLYMEKEIKSLASALYNVMDYAKKTGLANVSPGSGTSDQIVMLTGRKQLVLAEDYLSCGCEFGTFIIGDEASDLEKKTSIYAGNSTIAYRSTKVSLELLKEKVTTPRKTKIICTLGPACWSEEGLAKLIDAGMNVCRFNFSHGDHPGHQQVLDRVRKVATEKNAPIAYLLDTKGPEIRTAMLKDHQPIMLEQGQSIKVCAVGAKYTEFEGFKDASTGETVIGVSYEKLCKSLKPGGRILMADGTIVIQVVKILNDKELQGTLLNSAKLGERKNVNLPGVHVELPVLTEKDIIDLQDFCCKNHMDMVAASFVQTAEDVRFIRTILNMAGGKDVKIICKIENEEGLKNYDAILKETDGIMVARGDLGMEIPSEKVAIAQKMMITKANIAGKYVLTATQMLNSMEGNPLPTRAEMTDVANAVFDGTDATMLSGESANGKFPDLSCATMAAIVQNAECGVNHYQAFDFIRDFSLRPMTTREAVMSTASKNAIDIDAGLILVVTSTGEAARALVKYRPSVPVLVVTNSEQVVRHTTMMYAAYPYFVSKLPQGKDGELELLLNEATQYAVEKGLCPPGREVITITGCMTADAESLPAANIRVAPGMLEPIEVDEDDTEGTLSGRTAATIIDLKEILEPSAPTRKTKIICTLGPACWSEEGMAKLIDAGMNIARFNFSHGDHDGHKEVLDRLRKVAAEKGVYVATMLDTKGPEIRTAMLKNGEDITVEAGDEVTMKAVGDDYINFQGYKEDKKIVLGCSYAKLCQSVGPGSRILIADGTLSLEVVDIVSDSELIAKALNTRKIGQRKNMALPGVRVDIPVLTDKDVKDVQEFACKYGMDIISASFVQTPEDVRFIRKVLIDAGGKDIKIMSKIESLHGLIEYDYILEETDGIMVARGDLGMEIPSEKVCLAQKMLITKARIAGKFVVCATEMLASMQDNPLPTRPEMTDVANAVFDGVDATMLSGESANGKFPDLTVATMARITQNAEMTSSYLTTGVFLEDHSQKPFTTVEAIACAVAAACDDANAKLIVTFSEGGVAATMVSKYQPPVPQIVISSKDIILRQTNCHFGQFPLKAETEPTEADIPKLVKTAKSEALKQGLWDGSGAVVIMHGIQHSPDADTQPVYKIEAWQ